MLIACCICKIIITSWWVLEPSLCASPELLYCYCYCCLFVSLLLYFYYLAAKAAWAGADPSPQRVASSGLWGLGSGRINAFLVPSGRSCIKPALQFGQIWYGRQPLSAEQQRRKDPRVLSALRPGPRWLSPLCGRPTAPTKARTHRFLIMFTRFPLVFFQAALSNKSKANHSSTLNYLAATLTKIRRNRW